MDEKYPVPSIPDNTFDAIVYPNPASDVINIRLFAGEDVKNAAIEVYNSQGQLIKRKTQNEISELHVNISELKSGIYFLHIRSNNKYVIKSVMVQK